MAANTSGEAAPPATSVAIRRSEPSRAASTASCSRSARSECKRSSMSVKATTAPRPSGSSIGTETYDTGNIEPSRRKNQSRSLATVSPVTRGSSIGQSEAGYGVPSGCR
jgi:hypothetical protein